MRASFLTEEAWVAWLRRHLRGADEKVRLGVGDDAALVEFRPKRQIVVTSDLSVEGVHFSRSLHPPDSVGHRALARSLSDISAMGATPRFALISLKFPRATDRFWLEGFYRGMRRLAGRFGVAIVGGDTAVARGRIAADVVVLGDVERERALLRSGARSGDSLFVGGALGLSALGLRLLRKRPKSHRGAAVQSHLYPEPQCELGQFLSRKRLASAAIDISDGLSSDLIRLLNASGAGARLWENQIPTPSGASSRRMGLSLALDGGEDYKLLFAVPARKVRLLPPRFEGAAIHEIGTVCEMERGITIGGRNGARILRAGGYDHFRRSGKAVIRGS
ncbi:MAG: thiamine-phosphate kinase [Terriglobia bacterium]